VPIYEYRCEACGRRSSALLRSFAEPDPACPHCGEPRLRRLVSTFATVRSEGDLDDLGSDFGGDDDLDGGEDGGGFDDGDLGGFDDDF
jgi:putative FmdB family regulatory protein